MQKQELSQLQELLTPRLTRFVPAEHVEGMTPPQRAFLLLGQLTDDTRAPVEALYGGAAGGGKSDALLMAALQYVDVPGYAALILRRTFKQLALPDAIMARSKEWLSGTGAVWNEQRKQWTFPSGASLTFGHMQHEDTKLDYQGAAVQFVGFDELTQFSETQYSYLHSRTRRLAKSDVPVRVFSASNPGGIGHGWVKKRFPIDGKPRGRTRFIPARLTDNPHLDQPTYIASLSHLPDVVREQLLNGDWGIFEGMAYPEFDRAIHVVKAMQLPDNWDRWEAMDHGVTNPTAWGLFASDYDGNAILADLYYQPGLPEEHAPLIKDRRVQWWEKREDGWPTHHAAYGDPASLRESLPIQNDMGQPLSLQEHYRNLGVWLVPANNRRKIGFIEIRSRIKRDPERRFPDWHPLRGEKNAPSLFFVEHCLEAIDQVENAPLASEEADPERGEAVDRRWESDHGHAHAMLRYGLTQRSSASEEPKVETEDPREALLQRRREKREKPVGDDADYLEL